jgi:MFS transporter, NNP family, nitrate/nitrite transporter
MVDFFLMGLGVAAVAAAVDARNWTVFLTAFLFVFATTGIGNGSTYRMIPAIYGAQALTGVDENDGGSLAGAGV